LASGVLAESRALESSASWRRPTTPSSRSTWTKRRHATRSSTRSRHATDRSLVATPLLAHGGTLFVGFNEQIWSMKLEKH
jgi:hypothetical protein